MTPEIAGVIVIVFLVGLLAWVVWLHRQQRAAEKRERVVLQALDVERQAVMDPVEIQADAPVAGFIRAMSALWSRTSEICPYCSAHVEALEQVERSVYARPCGCRQGQGHVPDAWQTGSVQP